MILTRHVHKETIDVMFNNLVHLHCANTMKMIVVCSHHLIIIILIPCTMSYHVLTSSVTALAPIMALQRKVFI